MTAVNRTRMAREMIERPAAEHMIRAAQILSSAAGTAEQRHLRAQTHLLWAIAKNTTTAASFAASPMYGKEV